MKVSLPVFILVAQDSALLRSRLQFEGERNPSISHAVGAWRKSWIDSIHCATVTVKHITSRQTKDMKK